MQPHRRFKSKKIGKGLIEDRGSSMTGNTVPTIRLRKGGASLSKACVTIVRKQPDTSGNPAKGLTGIGFEVVCKVQTQPPQHSSIQQSQEKQHIGKRLRTIPRMQEALLASGLR